MQRSLIALLLVAAAPAPMGGLPPRTLKNGLIDASPLFRAEVALRRDARVKAIVIEPGGWRLTVAEPSTAQAIAGQACLVLLAEGIPAGVQVIIVATSPRRVPVPLTCRRE